MENKIEEEKKLAREMFQSWNEALKSKDSKKVAAFYSEGASFLPTVSPEFKNSLEKTEEYFEHFLEKNPSGKIIEDRVQPVGDSYFLHSGLYNFKISENGVSALVEARFTFAWQKDGEGKWKIVHHHSSKVPEGKKAA